MTDTVPDSSAPAIQLAKLSGFAPIITTASPKHESSLKALGATHVLDRSGPVTKAQVQAITRTSIKYIFDGVSTPETQKQGFEILAPGGKQVVVLHPEAFWEEGKKEDKAAIHVLGGKALPHHYELIKELFRNLTGLLEKGEIRVSISLIQPAYVVLKYFPAAAQRRGFAKWVEWHCRRLEDG